LAYAALMLIVLAGSVPAWARGGGGCLAEGAPIPTPAGAAAIETLRVGDPIWSVVGGRLQAGTVKALTETKADQYLEIFAGDSEVVITPEHPVMTGPGEYCIARLLKVGDRVYRMRHGKLDALLIRSIQYVRAHSSAYNLLVMPGGTFIPADIVVHNIRMLSSREPDSAIRRHRKADQRSPTGGSIACLFISAHAQKIVRKGCQILSEQQYVTPFDEYWTFGRLDDVWKLKEVLPPARGEKMITKENVDEESSAGQMQWYYRQTRAN
jgi:hypothetical protein